jgi:hypothetical protein
MPGDNITIVAIGNGDSVLNHKFGIKIDSFDVILRINNFEIKGYEEYIGNKTTYWARSDSQQIINKDYKQFKKILFCLPLRNFSDKARMDYVKSVFTENSEIVDKNIVISAQNKIISPNYSWPSTGLIALEWLLKKYDKVYIYGFDCFRKTDGFAKHYYNNKEVIPRVIGHKFTDEIKFINFYKKKGRIIHLQNI